MGIAAANFRHCAGTQVNFDAVELEGIQRIQLEDIEHAAEMGFRIKLLGVAQMTGRGLEQRMSPCLVPASSPLGQLEGGTNMVVIEGDAVEQIVRGEALRTFQSGFGEQRLPASPRIRWGVVGDEACETIDAGSHLYVDTSNTGSSPIYISVLGIAVDATISLLSQATPQGREVFGDTTYTLGEDALGKLVGIPIEWSPLVPRDGPRRAALVVIATDMPVDMRPLVTGTWPHAARCACGPEQVLPAPVRATRSAGRGASTRSARVAVRVFEFWVRP